MQLPMINDKNNNNFNTNNQNNNNLFKIESRANASGFLEDNEFIRKNNNVYMKKN